MIKQFQKFIEQQKLFNSATPVLLAISGGVDSMVLLNLFSRTFQHYAIAHCNFQLRGKESDGDEQLVKEQAALLKAQCFTERFNTKEVASEKKISIQMAARKLRYDWLEKIRSENGFHFIATAHHRDDSVETVLMNLAKGTGIHGLHGILPKHRKIIRPLFFTGKNEIRKFAVENKIIFREDSSNEKTEYRRNLIRKKIIPLFEEINPSFSETFSKNIFHFQEAEILFETAVNSRRKKIVKEEKGRSTLNIPSLLSHSSAKTLLHEILSPYNFEEAITEQLFTSIQVGESGKEFFSATHRIVLDRKKLILLPKQEIEFPVFVLEEKKDRTFITNKNEIEIRFKNESSRKRHGLIEIDSEKISFPILLRTWKKGDFFYPSGMKMKKKKLSDFFVSEKLSLDEKEKQYVLTDSKEKIICVVGLRADERFAISSSTKNYMTVTV